MSQSPDNVKRIAKNTGIVYVRMVLLILIAFYTSRVLLKTLGVVDFGVYSVVGSISGTFVAIRSLFSESIQRFLNVAKGKNPDDYTEQISIFNISLIIHLVLVVLFVAVVEVIGMWLMKTKLDIPYERYNAAVFVFQMTIISTVISILSITYDAVIIANEKMGFYATITVFDGLLKLLFVFLLPIIGYDYLKTYSLLLVFIPLSTLIIQLLYTRRFSECRLVFKFDKGLFKEIFSLASWSFIGNISFSLIHEGMNMLLNVFGGVLMNSARAIAYQVRSVSSQLTTNTMLAIRPSIMQKSSYLARKDFFSSIITLSRISMFAMIIPAAALILYTPQILDIWLETVPEKASLFTRIILFAIVIRSLHDPLNIMYMSLGKLKRFMIIESLIMVSFLVIIYFVLKAGAPIWSPFVLMFIMEIVIILGISINARYELEFPFKEFLKRVFVPLILIIVVSLITQYSLILFFKPVNLVCTLMGLLISLVLEISICFASMEKGERLLLKRIIKK